MRNIKKHFVTGETDFYCDRNICKFLASNTGGRKGLIQTWPLKTSIPVYQVKILNWWESGINSHTFFLVTSLKDSVFLPSPPLYLYYGQIKIENETAGYCTGAWLGCIECVMYETNLSSPDIGL